MNPSLQPASRSGDGYSYLREASLTGICPATALYKRCHALLEQLRACARVAHHVVHHAWRWQRCCSISPWRRSDRPSFVRATANAFVRAALGRSSPTFAGYAHLDEARLER